MSDMEVTLTPGLLPAFTDVPGPVAARPAAILGEESPNEIANNKTILMDTAPFPSPLNTTFFVKDGPDVEDEGSSIGSIDPPSAMIFEVEQKIRDSVNAIQFKEMLIARDRHSREIILRRCVEWLQMPTMRRRDRTLDWFTSLSSLKTVESIENSYLWHTLYESGIFACESFKTVISFFDAL